MNLLVIILSVVVYQVGNPTQQLARFLICALFCTLMVMGRSWARWVVVFLYTGSGLGGLLTGFSAITEGGVGFPLLVLGMAYLTPVLRLAFSPSVKSFFESRNYQSLMKPASCPVSFDLSGWNEIQRDEEITMWSNEYGDMLSLSVNAGGGDIDVSDSEEVIRFSRQFVASQGGAVVSINIVFLDSHRAIEIIFKTEHGLGYAYRGGLFCPVETTLVSVYAIFSEHGTTGVREAYVTASLWDSGELKIDMPEGAEHGESGKIKGWFFDPYDPNFEGETLNSISDDISYDATFPDHPLSALRRTLMQVRDSMAISEALE